jgi:chorismate mutase
MNLKEHIRTVNRPFVIAGPCSAESEEQVYQTCKAIADARLAQMLRAGIWKPRTRPDSFEGVGAIGLPWLVNTGRKVGLPISVEVANREHVELSLKAGVDVLWIGARTTVNPFAVQEIADVLKGVDIPVMVKNPVNPDLELWIGAFERLEKAGLTDLAAIHRGFSVYKHPKYRNVPNWEIPIALRERLPDLPIICDPSHISGKSELIREVSQKALDLNFDGLMIETHREPTNAWSDARQQVTPSELKLILDQLILRTPEIIGQAEFPLNELRDKITALDDRIFDLLMTRMRLSEDVGSIKKEHNITILQQEYWMEQINTRLGRSEEMQLSRVFIRLLMDAIHQESIRHQVKVMSVKKSDSL